MQYQALIDTLYQDYFHLYSCTYYQCLGRGTYITSYSSITLYRVYILGVQVMGPPPCLYSIISLSYSISIILQESTFPSRTNLYWIYISYNITTISHHQPPNRCPVSYVHHDHFYWYINTYSWGYYSVTATILLFPYIQGYL